jgi:hypothetical protein
VGHRNISIVDKLVKRIAEWRGKLLAYSSRLTLIKSCLASVHVFTYSPSSNSLNESSDSET